MDVIGSCGERVGVVVAHPDDEILWAGGTLLMRAAPHLRVCTLCRAGDADRAPKFRRVMEALGATGAMGDLDDGPAQDPLDPLLVQQAILRMVGDAAFDCLFTHGPHGEYTWHRRHVEVHDAVVSLWRAGALRAGRLCLFAYGDGGRAYLPRPIESGTVQVALPDDIWAQKRRLIQDVYGFAPDSWETRVTPRVEAFWCVDSPGNLGMIAEGRRG